MTEPGTFNCYYKPRRTRTRTFTARDAARIAEYAKRSGVTDAELLHELSAVIGIRPFFCLLDQIVTLLQSGIAVGALIGLIKGTITIAKGIRFAISGQRSRIALTILEIILPARWTAELGVLFLWTGTIEAIGSAMILFLTELAENLGLQGIIKAICEGKERVPTDPEILWNETDDRSLLDLFLLLANLNQQILKSATDASTTDVPQ